MRQAHRSSAWLRFSVASMFATALLVLALGGVAMAKKKKKKKKGNAKTLTTVLDELAWGMSSKEVMGVFKDRLDKEFEAEADSLSSHKKKDRLRRKYDQDYARIKKSQKDLKGGTRSGLEVSVVADEFVNDNGESVIVVKEEIATRYYFFLNDKFYKLAIAYKPSYVGDTDFGGFVGAVSKKYGKPQKEVSDDDGFFQSAIWEDKEGSRLRVDDKSETYATFLMAFTDRGIESGVIDKHKAAIEARYTEPEISSDIDRLTEGDDNAGSAADALLGGNTGVDLKAGLPQEDLDAMADGDIVKNTGDKGGVSKKKRKKKSKKKRTKFKDKDIKKKKGGSGVIIY